MSISRRGFLGGLAGGAGALVAGSAEASSPHKSFPGYAGRYGLLHDTTLCVGCRSCEKACNQVNDLPKPERPFDDKTVLDQLRHVTDNAYTVVNRYAPGGEGSAPVFRKHQCMHCNEPCCASVCFVKAFTKTPEGPVLYNPDVCVGCRYCMTACPYYATAYEYDEPLEPRVVRCTMCYPRIKEGKNPGCADACPMGAITYGRREDLIQVARDRIKKLPNRYLNHVFGEHEFGGTSWMVLAGVPFGKLDLHEGVSSTPLPETTKGFLSVVPFVLTIWPGFLLGLHAFNKRKEKLARDAIREAIAVNEVKGAEETKKQLEAAAKRAAKDKERSIDQAVKKALAEAKAKEDAK